MEVTSFLLKFPETIQTTVSRASTALMTTVPMHSTLELNAIATQAAKISVIRRDGSPAPLDVTKIRRVVNWAVKDLRLVPLP